MFKTPAWPRPGVWSSGLDNTRVGPDLSGDGSPAGAAGAVGQESSKGEDAERCEDRRGLFEKSRRPFLDWFEVLPQLAGDMLVDGVLPKVRCCRG